MDPRRCRNFGVETTLFLGPLQTNEKAIADEEEFNSIAKIIGSISNSRQTSFSKTTILKFIFLFYLFYLHDLL